MLIQNLVKNRLASAGEIRGAGLIPGPGRSPGRGNDNLFQYSCLENPMERGAWWAAVQRVTQSQTRLKPHMPSIEVRALSRNSEFFPLS